MGKFIVHVAEVDLSEESGMGRVAWHWKNEFEKRGYEFVHIGLAEVGAAWHPGLFPYAAYQAYQRLGKVAAVFLVHEPASGAFLHDKIPTVVVSHGVERRWWQLALQGKGGNSKKIKLRTRILFPLWRLYQCDLGLRKATKLLLINQEDANFTQTYYKRDVKHIHIFKNGVYTSRLTEKVQAENQITILFIGSWIERKGIRSIVEASQILYKQGLSLSWLMAGTSVDSESVLSFWPSEMHSLVEVIPRFTQATEESLFAHSHIFVLPSFFEGQPLALLQAMEAGRCCITTNCCGQRDLIQHGYNGLLHETGNAQQLASLIEQCVKDEELRITLGRNAKLSVKSRSWKAVSTEVVDQIEEILR